MGLISYNDAVSLTESVDVFNSMSMDKSKTLFRECLGSEFPFDVISAVADYAAALSSILNGGLDDILCGNALGTLADGAADIADLTVDSYERSSISSLFSDEDSLNNAQNYSLVDHTISSNEWIRDYTNEDFNNGVIEFYDGNLNAESVTINLNITGTVTLNEDSTYDLKAYYNCEVAVSQLQRGPKNSDPETVDGENLLAPIDGEFTFKGSVSYSSVKKSSILFISVPAEYIELNSNSDIELRIGGRLSGLELPTVAGESTDISIDNADFGLSIGPLKYNKAWSDIATGEGDPAFSLNTVLSDSKDMALNALRAEFMGSDVVDDVLDDNIDKLGGALGLDSDSKSNIKDSIKENIADSAITIANGGEIDLETVVTSTIVTEVVSSSVNKGLSKLGIDAEISTDCTRELLSNLVSLIGGNIASPFGNLNGYVDYGLANGFASGVFGDLSAAFDRLLSANCIKAINNQFNICSDNMANVVGNSIELLK